MITCYIEQYKVFKRNAHNLLIYSKVGDILIKQDFLKERQIMEKRIL